MPEDIHSPRQRGFIWSHMQWILAKRFKATDYERIKDFAKYPELRFLNRHDLACVILTAVITFLVGGTTALVWGFFVSIVCTWHVTFCINSLAHVLGRRRYETSDDSRNNAALALMAFGEGWHNNHHHYMFSARNGFFWWEIDITYYGIKALSWLGLVWDLKPVPDRIKYGIAPKTEAQRAHETQAVPSPETPRPAPAPARPRVAGLLPGLPAARPVLAKVQARTEA